MCYNLFYLLPSECQPAEEADRVGGGEGVEAAAAAAAGVGAGGGFIHNKEMTMPFTSVFLPRKRNAERRGGSTGGGEGGGGGGVGA